MLNREDNELLCRTGRGTPMGELFRRFWLPVIVSDELESDAAPKRLRVLGEDLLAFRDTEGAVGLVSPYCPHKGAPLFFGRNEDKGLRCVYHGWKFDVQGRCIETPNIPDANSAGLKARVSLTRYPVREAGGLVWAYLGPSELEPEMPQFDWLAVPSEQLKVARWLQRCNWATAMEGEIDASHVSFLHSNSTTRSPEKMPEMADGAPTFFLQEQPSGFMYGARRNGAADSSFYWRITQWFVPMVSMIANDPTGLGPRSGRLWVPIDDHHVMVFTYRYKVGAPFTPEQLALLESGAVFPPPRKPGTFALPDGYVIDTVLPLATRENDYLIDRASQKTESYTGIFSVPDQDRALQENMLSVPGLPRGALQDRSTEMLVAADLPVITARKILLRLAKGLAAGEEPKFIRSPETFRRRSAGLKAKEETLEQVIAAHGDLLKIN